MTNGEKYKIAQERAETFALFCVNCKFRNDCLNQKRGGGWKNVYVNSILCFSKWLDLECEEEKPLPCPFCGHETSANNCVGGWCVKCDCGYMSKQFNEGDDDEVLKRDSIAAHNRVAKKCMEVNE